MDLTRREALTVLAVVPLATALGTTPASAESALRAARRALAAGGYEPRFFTPHEWQTVRLLADMIIPADDRSGSATDAGVPEFMDFIMVDQPAQQTRMRGGLAWLDTESRRRHAHPFVALSSAQRAALLDDIAWPARAPAELSHGVAFFNFFRDMTASGFFSSRIGVQDLQYMGNTVVPEWTGCPPEALRRLGVSYDLMRDGGA